MATFVLVHGAWHGGWCWRKLVPILRSQAHEVFAPSLTGLGDRRHLLNRDITLQTHVADIESVFERETLHDVVLVAHSYGGMVATCVADRRGEQIKAVVYLSAFVPMNGQCLMDLSSDASRERFVHQARVNGDGWLIPVDAAKDPTFGVTDARDLEWMRPLLSPQPLTTFEEHVQLQRDNSKSFACVYVSCSLDSPTFEIFADRARLESWRTYKLETGHDAMITKPVELGQVLHTVASEK